MKYTRKRNNRKHGGEYLWTFPMRKNKDGSWYWACQYVVLERGVAKTITRGLGVKGAGRYTTNLKMHEKAARSSLEARIRNAAGNP